MITWCDQGLVLSVRPHGETSVILDLFTRDHGRHAGVVRGGVGRKLRPVLQPGAQLAVVWQARIEDHLGAFTVEPLRSRAGALADRLTLAGLASVTALLALALPDRDPHSDFHDASSALLDLADHGDHRDLWPLGYLRWELALLDEMGFGLDLTACAVTGATGDLAFVSPRSGRAVSRAAAGDWADRLLPLPPVLHGAGEGTAAEVVQALGTTGWFIEHRLLSAHGPRPLPPARDRLIAELSRMAD